MTDIEVLFAGRKVTFTDADGNALSFIQVTGP